MLACHIIANCQKQGGFAVYIDTERAINKEFMVRMGVNWDKLYRPKKTPATIEEVFDLIDKITTLARTHVPDKSKPVLIVWDSVAATPASGENEKGFEDQPTMALEARVMSRSFRKIIDTLDAGLITLVCVNQLREKIGVSFGDADVTPHGKALPFYSSVRVKLKSKGQIKDAKTARTLGVQTDARVFKNKVGPNWRTAQFPLFYDWGVNDEVSMMDYLCTLGAIEGSSWRTFKVGTKEYKWQGTEKWIEFMKDEEFKNAVLDIVEKNMIISLDRKPESIEIDEESLMEVEQLKDK